MAHVLIKWNLITSEKWEVRRDPKILHLQSQCHFCAHSEKMWRCDRCRHGFADMVEFVSTLHFNCICWPGWMFFCFLSFASLFNLDSTIASFLVLSSTHSVDDQQNAADTGIECIMLIEAMHFAPQWLAERVPINDSPALFSSSYYFFFFLFCLSSSWLVKGQRTERHGGCKCEAGCRLYTVLCLYCSLTLSSVSARLLTRLTVSSVQCK